MKADKQASVWPIGVRQICPFAQTAGQPWRHAMKAGKRASVWPVFCCPPARAVAPQHVHQLLAQRRRLCTEAHRFMQLTGSCNC